MSRFNDHYWTRINELSGKDVGVFRFRSAGTPEMPNRFSFHCRYRLSIAGTDKTFNSPLMGDNKAEKKHLESLGEIGESVVKQVLKVIGVTSIKIEEFHLEIEKGAMFTIEEIAPYITSILKALDEPQPTLFDEVGDTSALDEDFLRGLSAY